MDTTPAAPQAPPSTAAPPSACADDHARLLASHEQLQMKVESLRTQLQEWQQKAELWQTVEAARQTALEEKEKRHDELLATVQSTLEALLTQHQQHTQQQAEQAAATQQQWQQTMEQHKADTTTTLTTHRDDLLATLATHKQDVTTTLLTQHDAHTAAMAALDSTVSQHTASIAQLLPLDEEVGSIRTVLDTYNDDISGLVEREEAVRGKVEALRVESEQLLSTASDVGGRCKRVESEVGEVKRAGVEQAMEWKAAWQRVEVRVEEVSERLKEKTDGWREEQRTQQSALQQLVSGQHGQEKEMEALRAELKQLRQSMQRHRATTSAIPKAVEEQKDREETETGPDRAADMEPVDTSSTAANGEEDARELASPSHFTDDGPAGRSISASHDADSSATASPFLPLSPTSRSVSTSLSLSSDSLLPAPNRSHSISLPASPSDLSSVFPSVSLERQVGVFTSPAKVVQSTQAMAWTINVKDGGSARANSASAVSTPPPRHSVGNSRDAATTPRSAASTAAAHRHSTSALSASASVGKSGGGGSGSGRGGGSVAGSGRSSVSGSGVSSPNGQVSRQLAPELDDSGGSAAADGGVGRSAADVTVTADGQLDNGDVAGADDDETY